jgi:hypothetical protein
LSLAWKVAVRFSRQEATTDQGEDSLYEGVFTLARFGSWLGKSLRDFPGKKPQLAKVKTPSKS